MTNAHHDYIALNHKGCLQRAFCHHTKISKKLLHVFRSNIVDIYCSCSILGHKDDILQLKSRFNLRDKVSRTIKLKPSQQRIEINSSDGVAAIYWVGGGKNYSGLEVRSDLIWFGLGLESRDCDWVQSSSVLANFSPHLSTFHDIIEMTN